MVEIRFLCTDKLIDFNIGFISDYIYISNAKSSCRMPFSFRISSIRFFILPLLWDVKFALRCYDNTEKLKCQVNFTWKRKNESKSIDLLSSFYDWGLVSD